MYFLYTQCVPIYVTYVMLHPPTRTHPHIIKTVSFWNPITFLSVSCQRASLANVCQHRKGRTVVYESEEEEEAPATSLRSSWQSLKQWALSLGKPQQRRRGEAHILCHSSTCLICCSDAGPICSALQGVPCVDQYGAARFDGGVGYLWLDHANSTRHGEE